MDMDIDVNDFVSARPMYFSAFAVNQMRKGGRVKNYTFCNPLVCSKTSVRVYN